MEMEIRQRHTNVSRLINVFALVADVGSIHDVGTNVVQYKSATDHSATLGAGTLLRSAAQGAKDIVVELDVISGSVSSNITFIDAAGNDQDPSIRACRTAPCPVQVRCVLAESGRVPSSSMAFRSGACGKGVSFLSSARPPGCLRP